MVDVDDELMVKVAEAAMDVFEDALRRCNASSDQERRDVCRKVSVLLGVVVDQAGRCVVSPQRDSGGDVFVLAAVRR